MKTIWIIILILEGLIGFIISVFISHRGYFAFFGLILLILGIYGAIKKVLVSIQQ